MLGVLRSFRVRIVYRVNSKLHSYIFNGWLFVVTTAVIPASMSVATATIIAATITTITTTTTTTIIIIIIITFYSNKHNAFPHNNSLVPNTSNNCSAFLDSGFFSRRLRHTSSTESSPAVYASLFPPSLTNANSISRLKSDTTCRIAASLF